jgi:hypothetical protein
MHYSLFPLLTAATSVCILSACGAGGGQAALQPGDYFVYKLETTDPTQVVPPSKEYFARTFTEANADGSAVLEESSDVTESNQRTYSSEGLLSTKSRYTECTYAPAYTLRPHANTSVGETYQSTVTKTCVPQLAPGASAPVAPTKVVSKITISGTAQGTETYELPIGNFIARKYTATAVTTEADSSESKRTDTCWIDAASDKAVACDSSTTKPVKGSTKTTQSDSKQRLEGYVFAGGSPVGNTLPRFAGTWSISLGLEGICNGVKVDASGKLNGTCSIKSTLTPIGLTSAAITGTINAQDGSTTLVLGNSLLKLDGNFNSFKDAKGTFSPNNQVSNWIAKRTF